MGSTNVKNLFLSSIQLTEQRGLGSYSSVFSLSHRIVGHFWGTYKTKNNKQKTVYKING